MRFLWRKDPTSDVSVFQNIRHIFGAKDSPTCANYALRRTAVDNQDRYLDAAYAVLNNFYMDDYLGSVKMSEIALMLSRILVELLKLGGFNLTKIISIIPNLSSKLNPPKTSANNSKEIITAAINPETALHVLGLKWDHVTDTLVVSRGVNRELKDFVTQRSVLSFVSSVFDPIGLVAPYTVRARLLLKNIWRLSGQQWDDPLPNELCRRFTEWQSGLPVLGQFKIPRCYFDFPVDEVELNMFGDSSLDVFCSVVFLRAQKNADFKCQLAFVFGKARVAPMKMLSIPKSELQAALLASRLKDDIEKALTLSISKVFMWTDSTTVLQWLNSTSKQPWFVATRVAEILESTSIDQWFHVLSGDNPADTGTRGITADSLKQSSWVNGPTFLKTSDWLFNPNREVTEKIRLDGQVYDLNEGLEVSSNFPCTAVLTDFAFPWEKYSSFSKIKRLVAYMLRLSPKHRHFRSPDKAIIDPAELVIADEKLLQLSQLGSFPAESKQLTAGKYVKTSSRISSYSPFIGPNGLIRSTGRIQSLSATAFEKRHPKVLDSRHRLIRLFLRFYHIKYEHQSVDYLRSVIHQQFVVLRLRSALRAIETHCVCCRKRKAKIVTPMMSDFPAERLGYRQPPFSNCGVEYFGPFHVTIRRSSEKRWGFLFTCLTTRAIHIELLPSMDTSSCVMAIERFISRRGTPSIIWSDNGTNFVGAEKELLLCIKNWNAEAPLSLVHKGIK